MRNKALSTPHDRGYKRNLSNPKEFLHFLQKYIGDDWTKDLKVSQLKLCDKVYKKDNLPKVLHTVIKRAEKLEPQEQQELYAWIRNILMTICKGQEKAVEEILENAKKGGKDMEFQIGIIREFENEGRKGERRGKKILNRLNQCLKEDGRIDELLASINDTKLQNKLLKEYGLSTPK